MPKANAALQALLEATHSPGAFSAWKHEPDSPHGRGEARTEAGSRSSLRDADKTLGQAKAGVLDELEAIKPQRAAKAKEYVVMQRVLDEVTKAQAAMSRAVALAKKVHYV